jgi:hypothetical protein
MNPAEQLCDWIQVTRHLLMIRPATFGPNAETAPSNQFQHATSHSAAELSARALREFDGVTAALERVGVQVIAIPELPDWSTPDAVFPNNWVSTHNDGTAVLYPMAAINRRRERRPDLLRQIAAEGGFGLRRVIDLSWLEETGSFLEGTGSLVLDRVHGIAFAARSVRTHQSALAEFARLTGYRLVAFDASLGTGPVYHTNVLMSLGRHFAILCSEAISDPAARRAVVAELAATKRSLIEVSSHQVRQFAANCLEVDSAGGPVLVLSETALQGLQTMQRRALERHAALLPVDVATIERVGGGGVRCMLAEIHLPSRARLDSLSMPFTASLQHPES